MYDRAPRVLTATAPSNSTSGNIGPGTYDSESSAIKTTGYAPFLSMSKRESFLTVNEQVAIAPGPGHYVPDSGQLNKIKGGGALQNKSLRFSSSSSFTPGPGTYSLPSPLTTKTHIRSQTYSGPSSEVQEYVKGKGILGNKRVHYVRKQTAPSIPFPGQSHGYEEDELGQLKPQELPLRDKTMGPAYYNVLHTETMTTKKYKGVHFCNLRSLRSQFKGREGPGPGDYDPRLQLQGPSIAAQSQTAKLPRYHEIVPKLEEKKGVPGPGKYDVGSQFQHDPLLLEDATEPPPFGSSQQRFVINLMPSPPSTKYSDPRTAMESLKRVSGLTRSPFGQTAARFKADRNAREIPGPGTYNNSEVTAMTNELMKQAVVVGKKQSVFGTSSVRTAPMIKVDETELPGPAYYQHSEGQSKMIQKSSMFQSTSKRLHSPPPIVTSIPPPGSYEVSQAHSKSQGKIESKKDTPNSAFLSSNARFVPPHDVVLNETDVLNPGPGEYEPDKQMRVGTDGRGLICTRDARFKPTLKSSLGPGIYQLSKTQRDTLIKGTHNMTLNNPLKTEEEEENREQLLMKNKYKSPTRKQTIILTT